MIMLTASDYPVAWAMLIYELDDAHQHLRELVDQMVASRTIDEADYRVQLGHVFAHLNRAWNNRADAQSHELTGQLWEERSSFPKDLSPVG